MSSSVSKNYDLIAPIFDQDMALNMRFNDVGFYIDRVAGKGSVLEVGCGTGRISIPISKVCGELVGIDASIPMLLELRKKLHDASDDIPNIQLVAMDASAIVLQKKFDYILFGFSSINYLTHPEQVKIFLLSLKPLLNDGGRVLLDAFTPKPVARLATGWTDDYVRSLPSGGLLKRFKRITPEGDINFIQRRYEEYSIQGDLERVINTESRIRPYTPDELCSFLQATGFKVSAEWWNYGEGAGADFYSVEAMLVQ